MRTARFTAVVEKAGRPEVHLLWTKPAQDATLQRAIREGRVMSVHRADSGTAKDFGTVGFQADRHAQILIFPKSVRRFAERRIVGINYDLLADAGKAPARAKPRGRPQSVSSPRRLRAPRAAKRPPARPSEPARKRQKRERAAVLRNKELLREVKRAAAELNAGKAVAAYERLASLLDRAGMPAP